MGQQASGPQCPLPRQEIVTLYADGTVQADGGEVQPAQQVRAELCVPVALPKTK